MISESTNLLIIGDIFLEKIYKGETNRISPEAPVPIFNLNEVEINIGGAGIIAKQFIKECKKVHVIAIIGDDSNSVLLKNDLKSENISFDFIQIKNSETISRIKLYSGNQQLLRIDNEILITNEILNNFFDLFSNYLGKFNSIIFSDYNYGSLINKDRFLYHIKNNNISIINNPFLI